MKASTGMYEIHIYHLAMFVLEPRPCFSIWSQEQYIMCGNLFANSALLSPFGALLQDQRKSWTRIYHSACCLFSSLFIEKFTCIYPNPLFCPVVHWGHLHLLFLFWVFCFFFFWPPVLLMRRKIVCMQFCSRRVWRMCHAWLALSFAFYLHWVCVLFLEHVISTKPVFYKHIQVQWDLVNISFLSNIFHRLFITIYVAETTWEGSRIIEILIWIF